MVILSCVEGKFQGEAYAFFKIDLMVLVIYPGNIWNMKDRVFHISIHWEESWEYDAHRSILVWDVCLCGEALS